MPSKRQREQQKAARAASALTFKKRRLEASSILDLSQLETDDNRLSAADTSNTQGESGTGLGNVSTNGSDLDAEEEGHLDGDGLDLAMEKYRTEPAASLRVPPAEIKWNADGDQKFRGTYGKGSRSSLKRQKKSARELAKEASKSYNIGELWQRNRDLGLTSSANAQRGLGQNPLPAPICPLAEIPRGGPTPQLK